MIVIINVRKITPIGNERRKYNQFGTIGLYLTTGYKSTPTKVIYKKNVMYFFIFALNSNLLIRRFFII